jgi:hypothetical protein
MNLLWQADQKLLSKVDRLRTNGRRLEIFTTFVY